MEESDFRRRVAGLNRGDTMTKKMTPSRQIVLQALIAFKTEHDGLSPPVSILAERSGFSESSVKYHLLRLQNDGAIEKTPHGLKVLGGRWLPPAEGGGESAAAPAGDPPADIEQLRREREHFKRASEMNLEEADAARAAVAKVEGQLQEARTENRQLRAQIAERDETIAALRAELAKRPKPVPVRHIPAPVLALSMSG
jgi:hypothetical protein